MSIHARMCVAVRVVYTVCVCLCADECWHVCTDNVHNDDEVLLAALCLIKRKMCIKGAPVSSLATLHYSHSFRLILSHY